MSKHSKLKGAATTSAALKFAAPKHAGPKHATLPPEKLCWRCDPATIPFETTAEVPPSSGDPGQERALRALRMGVELTAPGYNLFVCGLSGTSRGGMIVRMIEGLHPQSEPAPDRAYVNNFQKCRPAASAHSAARPRQRLQERSRVRHRFSSPPHSSSVRRRTLPAPENAHR